MKVDKIKKAEIELSACIHGGMLFDNDIIFEETAPIDLTSHVDQLKLSDGTYKITLTIEKI